MDSCDTTSKETKEKKMEIDTGNYQAVSIRREKVCILLPKLEMTKLEARTLAAWLEVMSREFPEHGPSFSEIVEAIENT